MCNNISKRQEVQSGSCRHENSTDLYVTKNMTTIHTSFNLMCRKHFYSSVSFHVVVVLPLIRIQLFTSALDVSVSKISLLPNQVTSSRRKITSFRPLALTCSDPEQSEVSGGPNHGKPFRSVHAHPTATQPTSSDTTSPDRPALSSSV